MVIEGELTMGQVRPLIGHPDCVALAGQVVAKGLSARQVEALAKSSKSGTSGRSGKAAPAPKTADILGIEHTLADKRLAVDMNWDEARGSGRLVIRFRS